MRNVLEHDESAKRLKHDTDPKSLPSRGLSGKSITRIKIHLHKQSSCGAGQKHHERDGKISDASDRAAEWPNGSGGQSSWAPEDVQSETEVSQRWGHFFLGCRG
ncbi:hypothetical protein SRHO_G00106770 [Serrasalmus rhombeus]